MPSWLGGPEILILVLVLVLLFGAKKLPDTARGLGRSLRIFKSEIKAAQDDDGNTPPQQIQAAPGEVSSTQPNVAPPAAEPTAPDSNASDR
jgi:sec-independent protein translocase protein TatA